MTAIALILGGFVIAGAIVFGFASAISSLNELKTDAKKWRDLQNGKENS